MAGVCHNARLACPRVVECDTATTGYLDAPPCKATNRTVASLQTEPGAASVLCGYRDLEWWLGQKGCRDRVFHPRQHYPKLNNCDRDMNMAVGGLPWRVVARDRDAWKSALPKWVAAKDLPWSRGRQDAIDC